MDDAGQTSTAEGMVRWPHWLIAIGATLVVLSVSGLVLIQGLPEPKTQAAQPPGVTEPARQTASPPSIPAPTLQEMTPTPLGQALIERRVVAPSTRTPTPGPTETSTPKPPPLIEWTAEEKNALSWLCYGEIGGMAEAKIDACLSVISTVRARYAYAVGGFPETDVISTLLRPGQFHVAIHTDRPAADPDLYWAVEQYQYGMRGSCNGYLYFNSIPGGPSECVIRSSNGQFMQFHNSW